MRAVETKTAKGRLRWIRVAVNERQTLHNEKVAAACRLRGAAPLEWVSPLKRDQFAEYGDQDFLNRLGVDPTKRSLRSFWPNRGPQWDALARRN